MIQQRAQKSTNPQRELLRWHICLEHLSFKTFKQFAILGIILKHLANVVVLPICACCAFAKATKRVWCAKVKSKSIFSEQCNFPGGCVSVDQLNSAQTGMIPQSSGYRVVDRYVGATVFVDNFLPFVYIHYMTRLSTEQTMEVKLAFERVAEIHSVTIKSYRANNGCFADKAFKDHCGLLHQELTF